MSSDKLTILDWADTYGHVHLDIIKQGRGLFTPKAALFVTKKQFYNV